MSPDTLQFDLFDDPANRLLTLGSYGEFRRALAASGCCKCELATGRTNLVVDRGNPQAHLMLVGEGPGEQEDRTGQAFVGRAGRLLDELMKGVGLDTGRDTLIANVVKCRPPGNRAPQAEEARTCLPYLQRQIQLVRPECILLLGATAARFLFAVKRSPVMADEVGRFFTSPEYPGIRFMLLYHPAFLLRDPRRRKDMEEHLRTFNAWWSASR